MSIVIATFVSCAAFILGAYWLFVVRPESTSARALQRRLTAEPVERPHRSQKNQLAKTTSSLTTLKIFDVVLARLGNVNSWLETTVQLSNLSVTPSGALLASGVCAAAVFASVWSLSSLPIVALFAGTAAGALPIAYIHYVKRARMARIEEQLPQAIELIGTSLRAGHAFTTGLLMVADELPDPLGTEFRLLYDQQNYGKALPEVLREFAARIPLLDARIFVTAVLTQRETGGNLAEVLDKLAGLIRERFNVRRQVRAVSAHGRITGTVLTLLPPVLAAVLMLIAPDHVMVLVTDPIGIRLTIIGIILQITGAIAIRRIVNIEF
jgi:tight adherence protein B